MSPEPPLDATGIARRQFSTVRKGYDPSEVRAFLNELSEVMGRLQREEAHEHERAERAENRAVLAEQLDEHRLVELLGEETARVLEAAREAAGGIRAKAEESAARMVREAQAEARSVTEQAERDAGARRAEIIGEVEDLRREATDELDRRRVEGQILIDDMRRVAESERDQMVADGERSRAEADAAAEQIRAAARDQGRRLVGEAQAVRERILGDLARRRRTAREQLERLNGARERLLAAYEVVRRTADEATTELTVALPEARVASAAAVQRVRDEPDESVDVLEAELSVARMSGAIDEGSATVSDAELDAMLRELAEEEAAQAAARREAEAGMALGEAEPLDDLDEGPAVEGEAADTTDRRGDDESGADSAAGAAPGDAVRPGRGAAPDAGDATGRPPGGSRDPAAPPQAVVAAPDPVLDSSAAPTTAPSAATGPAPGSDRSQSDAERWGVRLPKGRRVRRADSPAPSAAGAPATARAGTATVEPLASAGTAPPRAEARATEAAPAEATTPEATAADVATTEDGETGPYVDELFARIRAERGGRAPAAATGEGGSVAVAERDVDAVDVDDAATSAAAANDEGTTAEDDPEIDPMTRALRTRDDALGSVEREMGRRLKRILADEQNEVLDTLRRGGTVDLADVLPEGDEHADRYAIAIGADLDAAAGHGAAAGGAARSTSCDALAGELGRALVQPLRVRVERSFHDSDGDVEEITERLRALYREWKGQRIGAAVRHYTAAAYSVGVADALPAGAPQRWIVDPSSCAACPDCDDNALAGEVVGGEAFPTGDTRAPAHPDCRCLVVAAAILDTTRAGGRTQRLRPAHRR